MEQLTAEQYGSHAERVARLVAQSRAGLTAPNRTSRPVEAQQLGVAGRAVAANFLRLALLTALERRRD